MDKQLITTLQTEFNQLSNHFRDVKKMVSIEKKMIKQSALPKNKDDNKND